jgi:hypothetical protein
VKCPEGLLKRYSVQHGPRSMQDEHRLATRPTRDTDELCRECCRAATACIRSGCMVRPGARGCARFEHLGGFGRLLFFQSASTKVLTALLEPMAASLAGCGR